LLLLNTVTTFFLSSLFFFLSFACKSLRLGHCARTFAIFICRLIPDIIPTLFRVLPSRFFRVPFVSFYFYFISLLLAFSIRLDFVRCGGVLDFMSLPYLRLPD
jgi:hypothetical protein